MGVCAYFSTCLPASLSLFMVAIVAGPGWLAAPCKPNQGDKIVYDVDGRGCSFWSVEPVDPAFCLSMSRWQQLVDFCTHTGIRLVFALNAMTRSSNTAHNNFTNIDAFLGYVAAKNQVCSMPSTHPSTTSSPWHSNGQTPTALTCMRCRLGVSSQTVFGFEFGNELPQVDPVVMGQDYLTLRSLINKSVACACVCACVCLCVLVCACVCLRVCVCMRGSAAAWLRRIHLWLEVCHGKPGKAEHKQEEGIRQDDSPAGTRTTKHRHLTT